MSDSNSDIEIVERKVVDKRDSGVDHICQLCSYDLRSLTPAERDVHYGEHSIKLETRPLSKGRKRKATSVLNTERESPQMKLGKGSKRDVQQDVFWYPAQSKAPPDNYSPGVLSVLKEALKKSHKKGATLRAVLCYERTPHIFRESFDVKWGCGSVISPRFRRRNVWANHADRYRNFLMACAALMDQQSQPIYFAHLDSPSPPGIQNLQQWIEDAWEQGYDEIGASELGHKLVGTTKQIGTGELYVAFTSRKIPCTLVDFDLGKSSKGFDIVIDWVVNYFTEKLEGDVNQVLRAASPVVATGKMPVIMQFKGHSVTIVGYELAKNDKYSLLVLDPSSRVTPDIRQAALNTTASTNPALSSLSLGKGKRREQSGSSTPRKRARANQDPDDEVVSISDSDDGRMDNAHQAATLQSTPDPDKVIKTFRLGNKYVKLKECQLLYFTMGDPLSDQEQNDSKVVLAEFNSV